MTKSSFIGDRSSTRLYFYSFKCSSSSSLSTVIVFSRTCRYSSRSARIFSKGKTAKAVPTISSYLFLDFPSIFVFEYLSLFSYFVGENLWGKLIDLYLGWANYLIRIDMVVFLKRRNPVWVRLCVFLILASGGYYNSLKVLLILLKNVGPSPMAQSNFKPGWHRLGILRLFNRCSLLTCINYIIKLLIPKLQSNEMWRRGWGSVRKEIGE